MNLDLSSAASALLNEAGWTPERRFDPVLMIEDLAMAGFRPSDAAFEFLRCFGKLRVEHDPSVVIGDRLIRSSSEFDPARVCTTRDAEVANLCSVLIDKTLFPVGVDSWHMTVYVAQDGMFYSSLDASVFEYADDYAGLFDNMAKGVRPRRLADWA